MPDLPLLSYAWPLRDQAPWVLGSPWVHPMGLPVSAPGWVLQRLGMLSALGDISAHVSSATAPEKERGP